jgi:hypothetical protein
MWRLFRALDLPYAEYGSCRTFAADDLHLRELDHVLVARSADMARMRSAAASFNLVFASSFLLHDSAGREDARPPSSTLCLLAPCSLRA